MGLFTPAWWNAASQRAAYTALAALSGLILLLLSGEVTVGYVVSFVAVALLASFATSLTGLPEVTGNAEPLWRAILTRCAKTAAQIALPALAAVTLLEQISWDALGVQVAAGVLTTLIRTLQGYLPEVPEEDQALPVVTPVDGDPAADYSTLTRPFDADAYTNDPRRDS